MGASVSIHVCEKIVEVSIIKHIYLCVSIDFRERVQ